MSMALMGATGVAVQAAETEKSAQEQAAEDNTKEAEAAEDTENADKTEVSKKEESAEKEDVAEKEDAAEKEDIPEDRIAVQIMLEETTAEAGSESVQIDGTTVTITEGGTYMLSGRLFGGQIVVDAGETAKVNLIFNGVRITNDGKDCISVKSADEVTVTLSGGSENIFSAGSTIRTDGREGYADDYADDYGRQLYEDWEDNGYWDTNDRYPDWEDYGYRDEDDRYPEWDSYRYRDGASGQDPAWDDYGYWDEWDGETNRYPDWDGYRYWDDDRYPDWDGYRYWDDDRYSDREDYSYRDEGYDRYPAQNDYKDQSRGSGRDQSGDDDSRTQTAPPEKRPGRGSYDGGGSSRRSSGGQTASSASVS